MKTSQLPTALVLACLLALPATGQAQLCGTQKEAVKRYDHVVWIWMENHSYAQIIGSPDAPYINSLASSCGLATNFHNTSHFSLPNYIAAVTGLGLEDVLKFDLDCNPGGTCLTPAESIFSQVGSWKAYMESMETNCQLTGFFGYSVRHNPPPYLSSLVNCTLYDVRYTELQTDLDANTLPVFSFITPNSVNDMHDGPDPTAIHNGDAWLQAELPKLLGAKAYQDGRTLVFVTFDEGEFGPGFAIGEDCARNTTDESCHIATIVISPSVRPGTTSNKLFNHYSMLRTTEKLLGIPRKLGLAGRAHSMQAAFHL